MRKFLKKYFTIGTDEWKITVKWCLVIGFCLGLLLGLTTLLKIL